MLTRNFQLFAVLGAAFLLSSVASVPVARAQVSPDPGGAIEAPAPLSLFVVGRDVSLPVRAKLPAECAGTSVEVALFDRSGAQVLGRLAGFDAGKAMVALDGTVVAEIPLPAAASGPARAWPGIAGDCLKQPLVSQRDPLVIGVVDTAENGTNSATFVVPAKAVEVARTAGGSFGTIRATVDGIECATASFTDATATDASGAVRVHVGGASQPGTCAREGAVVTFYFPDGRALYERRTFVAGVTQLFSNLAPEAAPNTGVVSRPGTSAAPAPPATGAWAPARSSSGGAAWPRWGLAALVGALGFAGFAWRRRHLA